MDELSRLLDKLEALIAEAGASNCPYVGVFELECLLKEYGRELPEE